jgi:hypothetical protein
MLKKQITLVDKNRLINSSTHTLFKQTYPFGYVNSALNGMLIKYLLI